MKAWVEKKDGTPSIVVDVYEIPKEDRIIYKFSEILMVNNGDVFIIQIPESKTI